MYRDIDCNILIQNSLLLGDFIHTNRLVSGTEVEKSQTRERGAYRVRPVFCLQSIIERQRMFQ
jgi:hypothetical protein